MQIELKPCPFCGHAEIRIRPVDDPKNIGGFLGVWCETCRATMATDCNENELVKRWNTRRESAKAPEQPVELCGCAQGLPTCPKCQKERREYVLEKRAEEKFESAWTSEELLRQSHLILTKGPGKCDALSIALANRINKHLDWPPKRGSSDDIWKDTVQRLLSVMESKYPFLSKYMDSQDKLVWEKQIKVAKERLFKIEPVSAQCIHDYEQLGNILMHYTCRKCGAVSD